MLLGPQSSLQAVEGRKPPTLGRSPHPTGSRPWTPLDHTKPVFSSAEWEQQRTLPHPPPRHTVIKGARGLEDLAREPARPAADLGGDPGAWAGRVSV